MTNSIVMIKQIYIHIKIYNFVMNTLCCELCSLWNSFSRNSQGFLWEWFTEGWDETCRFCGISAEQMVEIAAKWYLVLPSDFLTAMVTMVLGISYSITNCASLDGSYPSRNMTVLHKQRTVVLRKNQPRFYK